MDLWYGMYRGKVTNAVDPEGLYRVKAVVPQIFGSDVAECSWAWPCLPPAWDGTMPTPGQGVWISFMGGDIEYPIWHGVWMPTILGVQKIKVNAPLTISPPSGIGEVTIA